MYCKAYCAAIIGVNAKIVQVEADVNEGLPVFNLVGYLNSEVKEARERVRSSIKNLKLSFKAARVTVNLSPADIRKEGTAYDLSIAVSLLGAFGYIGDSYFSDVMLIGELSLDGQLNGVNGVLPMVWAAKENGFKYCIVPKKNINEGIMVHGIGIIGADSLEEVMEMFVKGDFAQRVITPAEWNGRYNGVKCDKDFSDVSGQDVLKRAAFIAVAGGHNLLMLGASGSGKTMIAERIPGIMPYLTLEESIQVSKIYSIYGGLRDTNGYMYERPFRRPHHSIPPTGLIGGGGNPKPGEISLAHKGVLFMDELTEFNRSTLELLRVPIESRKIVHSRNNCLIEYPSDFMLVASMNPCPCGNFPNRDKCKCSDVQIKRYMSKLSAAFMDRIDIIAEAECVSYDELCSFSGGETSEMMRNQVMAAVELQKERYKNDGISRNAELTHELVKKWCDIDRECRLYLKNIFTSFDFSARTYHRILKVARTIADIEGGGRIKLSHIEEAVFYKITEKRVFGNGGTGNEY